MFPGQAGGWQPPPSFDGFDVVRSLGQGGMGAVWLGHDAWLDRPTALKFIAGAEPDQHARQRFLTEARALARLQHPNVAGVYRVGEVEGRPYIAYEYVGGVPLSRAPRPMSWRQALGIGIGVARGLGAAHRRGVIHRDVKPANIVLTESGEPKLLDFGLARIDGGADPSSPASRADGPRGSVPSGAALAGTPLYLAPELWLGHTATVQSDLYALGLVLYELVAGGLPFEDLDGHALFARIQEGGLPPLHARGPELPPAFAEAIARATRAQAAARYQSVDELCDALEAVRTLYGPFVASRTLEDEGREDAERVATSFAAVLTDADRFASAFYEGLFRRSPQLRELFPADLELQKQKLVGALQLIVQQLGSADALVPFLEDLGRRHADYGVDPADFEAAGQQLLEAMRHVLQERFTPSVERAWAFAYDRLARTMTHGLLAARACGAETVEHVPPARWTLPLAPAQTRYARSGGASIAYQVLGQGPLDLLVVPGWVSSLELTWQEPGFATLLRRLASFTRVIVVDKRGTGLSDRVTDRVSLDDERADLVAVLDAVGSERPVVLGLWGGAHLALLLAAAHPERVRGVVAYGSAPRLEGPAGLSAADAASLLAEVRDRWGEPLFFERVAPSRTDEVLRRWWAGYLRAGAGPGAAEALLARELGRDVTGLLPSVQVPSLVLHRSGDRLAPPAGGRALAAGLRGARLAVVQGADHLPFAGDPEPLVDELQRFVSTLHAPATVSRNRLVTAVAFSGSAGAASDGAIAVEAARRRADAAHDDGEARYVVVDGPVAGRELAEAVIAAAAQAGEQIAAAVACGDDDPDAPAVGARAIAAAHGAAPGAVALDALATLLVDCNR